MNSKVLILGSTGMLGSMVYHYLSKFFMVAVTFNKVRLSKIIKKDIKNEFFLNAENADVKNDLKEILDNYSPDYIINCIGIIKPFCKDSDMNGVSRAIKVNALFPHILSEVASQFTKKIKIIQIATDCVYDGLAGDYLESQPHNPLDVYGKTKSLGEVISDNIINLRCSIIGPELKNRVSLLEWFLSQDDDSSVKGYINHNWNGVTTLQYSQLCKSIIENDEFEYFSKFGKTVHYVINESVSKYELIKIFQMAFGGQKKILKHEASGSPINRTIQSELFARNLNPMVNGILELRDYMKSTTFWSNNDET